MTDNASDPYLVRNHTAFLSRTHSTQKDMVVIKHVKEVLIHIELEI